MSKLCYFTLQGGKSEDLQTWIDSEFTNRQVLFGNFYEETAVDFTGIASLSKQVGEALDEWKHRVDCIRSENIVDMRTATESVRKFLPKQKEIRAVLGLPHPKHYTQKRKR